MTQREGVGEKNYKIDMREKRVNKCYFMNEVLLNDFLRHSRKTTSVPKEELDLLGIKGRKHFWSKFEGHLHKKPKLKKESKEAFK